MRRIIIFLIGLGMFSCQQKEKNLRPEGANITCDGFFAQGQFENDLYIYCSVVPVEISYFYKTGNWKYWNGEGQLIAEGTYMLEEETVELNGGCSYEIIVAKIEKQNWKFWDEKGKPINVNDELLEKFDTCSNNKDLLQKQ